MYQNVLRYQAYTITTDGLLRVATDGYSRAWPQETEAEAFRDAENLGGNVVMRVVVREWVDDEVAQ